MIKSYQLCFFVLFISAMVSAEYTTQNGVIVLTGQNFDQVLAGHELLMLEFYAPWCGHCKKLAPQYEKTAKELDSLNSKARLAKLDATAHKSTAQKFNVTHFPTIYFIKNQIPRLVEDIRTAPQLVKYILKKSQDPVIHVQKEEKLQQHIQTQEILAVYFGNAGSERYQLYSNIADSDQHLIKFYRIDSDTRNDIILYVRQRQLLYTDENNSTLLSQWIDVHGRQAILQFNPKAIKLVFTQKNPGLLVLNIGNDTDSIFSILKNYCGQPNFQLLCVNAEKSNPIQLQLARLIGVDISESSKLAVLDTKKQKLYLYQQNLADITKQLFTQFYASYLNGSLKQHQPPTRKKDPQPTYNITYEGQFTKQNGVIVLNETNFETAISTYSNILVEFYAPWCGHCKSLAPIYESAAQKLADTKFKLAKVNADAHKPLAQSYGVEGYPTLIYFIRGIPVKYLGDRTQQKIIQWVQSKDRSLIVTVVDQQHINEIIQKNNTVALIFYGSKERPEYKGYQGLSLDNEFFNYLQIQDPQLIGQNPQPSLHLYYKQQKYIYRGDWSLRSLVSWTQKRTSQKTVLEFDQAAIDLVFNQGNTALIVFNVETDSKNLLQIMNRHCGKDSFDIYCANSPKNTDSFDKLLAWLKFKQLKESKIIIFNPSGQALYFYQEKVIDITEEKFLQFYDDFINGKLKEYVAEQKTQQNTQSTQTTQNTEKQAQTVAQDVHNQQRAQTKAQNVQKQQQASQESIKNVEQVQQAQVTSDSVSTQL